MGASVLRGNFEGARDVSVLFFYKVQFSCKVSDPG